MNPYKQFRQVVFSNALDYLESKWLTEQEICECLKQCLEFFWGGNTDGEVVRDFCITKIDRADNGKA